MSRIRFFVFRSLSPAGFILLYVVATAGHYSWTEYLVRCVVAMLAWACIYASGLIDDRLQRLRDEDDKNQ